jgi:hypothetical protein
LTSYSGMAARGREESARTTTGRRKQTAERIEYEWPDRSNVIALGGSGRPLPVASVVGRLVGSCGHTLRWLAAVPVVDGEPRPSYYLTVKLGRKMTCQHNDCRIVAKPPRAPRDTDCTWTVGTTDENEHRCRVTAKWDTSHGRICTRHRDHLLREGYLDDAGTPL